MDKWMARGCGLACLLLASVSLRGGESVVFSVTTPIRSQPPWWREQSTEIYSFDPANGEKRLVFSEAATPLVLVSPSPFGGQDTMVAAEGRLFAQGRELQHLPAELRATPYSVYELFLDGSNRYRKVVELQDKDDIAGNFWHPQQVFVNPGGTKVGVLKWVGDSDYIFIHDVATGALLHKTDLRQVLPGCEPSKLGWTADGERLFFMLYEGDADGMTKDSCARIGSWVMKEDGSGLERMSSTNFAEAGLPGSRYLFRESQWNPKSKSRTPATSLYVADVKTGARKDYALSAQGILYCCRVSDSGRFVAFLEEKSFGEPFPVWMLDLETGKEQVIFSFPTGKTTKEPWSGLIGWLRTAPSAASRLR